MYLFENPVLQRELLVNLRMPRAFLLLLTYQLLLAAVVYFAWPKDNIRLDLTANPESTRQLVNLFFLGQYILASLMAPQFRSGRNHRRERAQDVRNAVGQPTTTAGHRDGKTGCRIDSPGNPDFRIAAHRYALPAAGWGVVL